MADDVKALVHHVGIAMVGVRIPAAAKGKKVPQSMAGPEARECRRPLLILVPTVRRRLCRDHRQGSAGGDQESEIGAGLEPEGDGRGAGRRSRYRPHHEVEVGRERPALLGGHIA